MKAAVEEVVYPRYIHHQTLGSVKVDGHESAKDYYRQGYRREAFPPKIEPEPPPVLTLEERVAKLEVVVDLLMGENKKGE